MKFIFKQKNNFFILIIKKSNEIRKTMYVKLIYTNNN